MEGTTVSFIVSEQSQTNPYSQAFWDATGGLWAKGALAGKYAGVFVSTGSHGGGQEATVMNTLSTLTHHGIIFVPFGYSHAFPEITNLSEVHAGECSL